MGDVSQTVPCFGYTGSISSGNLTNSSGTKVELMILYPVHEIAKNVHLSVLSVRKKKQKKMVTR